MYVTENTGCHTCNADWYGTEVIPNTRRSYILYNIVVGVSVRE